MSAQTPIRTSLPESWPDFLSKIQKTLENAVQATEPRGSEPPLGQKMASTLLRQELDAFQERWQGFEALRRSAAESMAQADAALSEGEELLRRYRAASQDLQEKLAHWAGRAHSRTFTQ